MRDKLTEDFCETVTKPGRYSDGGNLYLFIQSNGRKSWVFRFRDKVTGKRHDMGLGAYGPYDVSLQEAREAAGIARKQVNVLINPIVERKRLLREAQEAYANK